MSRICSGDECCRTIRRARVGAATHIACQKCWCIMYREGLQHVTNQARYLVMASLHLDVEIGVDTCTVAAVDEMDHAVVFIIDVQGLSITLPAPGKHQHQHVRYLLRPWRPRHAGLRARHTLSSAHLTLSQRFQEYQKNSNCHLHF